MFGSLMTAMVTPFDDEGKLDLSQVPKLIDHLLSTGTTAIVVAGTTGESPTLTHDEKLALFDACVSYAKGKIGTTFAFVPTSFSICAKTS